MPDRFARLDERFVGWLSRAEPARREITLASLFLLVLMVVGAVGYRVIEDMTWPEGLYMTFITLSTIGFSEVKTLSTAGRFFTMFIGIAGIGIVAFIATRSAQVLLANPNLRDRQRRRRLQRMDKHYIICGYGRVGRRIAQDLKEAGTPFVIIEVDPEKIEQLEEENLPHVPGDAEEEQALLEAGVERALGLILALPEDSTNVFVTLMARELSPGIFILSRINDFRNRRKLLVAGANKVVAPDEIGADRMSQVILRPHVDRFMEQVLHTGALGLQMEEVHVDAGAAIAGKSLADCNFQQEYEAIVIALIDGESGEMKFNPNPHARLKPGSVLIVLGSPAMIRRLREVGTNAQHS